MPATRQRPGARGCKESQRHRATLRPCPLLHPRPSRSYPMPAPPLPRLQVAVLLTLLDVSQGLDYLHNSVSMVHGGECLDYFSHYSFGLLGLSSPTVMAASSGGLERCKWPWRLPPLDPPCNWQIALGCRPYFFAAAVRHAALRCTPLHLGD